MCITNAQQAPDVFSNTGNGHCDKLKIQMVQKKNQTIKQFTVQRIDLYKYSTYILT